MKIYPSMLSANFCCLGEELRELNDADGIHWDVMDGHFVDKITFGADIIAAHREITSLPFDVHLMIDNPEKHIRTFAEAGADIITVHVESTNHIHKVLQDIKSFGKKSCIAINPGTSTDFLKYIDQDLLDSVLIMTVNPGQKGQRFLMSQIAKITKVQSLFIGDIGVDGGVSDETISNCEGISYAIAGSYIFDNDDYSEAIENLKLRNRLKSVFNP
ncbi:MAG: ribulose-phosphate 3-epimerase [Alphaproteobacteria bacterium]|nr:ribulose-phosphate 3-epimerase [Alphaproteobacteria bacterium]